jgi:hypothetical protein
MPAAGHVRIGDADAEDVGDLHVVKAMRVLCSLTKGIELPRRRCR